MTPLKQIRYHMHREENPVPYVYRRKFGTICVLKKTLNPGFPVGTSNLVLYCDVLRYKIKVMHIGT